MRIHLELVTDFDVYFLFQVAFRPWADLPDAGRDFGIARQLTVTRCHFWNTERAVWYLGERVVRQHSSAQFLVPHDPPASMLYSHALAYELNMTVSFGGATAVNWRELVYHDVAYEHHLARLATPVIFPIEVSLCFLIEYF